MGKHLRMILTVQNTRTTDIISTILLSLKVDTVLYKKRVLAMFTEKSISQWIKLDLCNGNCLILTTKKKTYINTVEMIFMKKKLSDLYCYRNQGQWDDLTISWRQKVRAFLFTCEKFNYRYGIDLSAKNKNKNFFKSQIFFFMQPLNKSSYFTFLVERNILQNTWNKHLTSFLPRV